MIFEARTKANKGCANSGNLEYRTKHFRRQKLIGGMAAGGSDETSGGGNQNNGETNSSSRSRRDVRDATKFIETALVIDKAMFDKRNGSTRAEVVHDAIQVANIADLVRILLRGFRYRFKVSFPKWIPLGLIISLSQLET